MLRFLSSQVLNPQFKRCFHRKFVYLQKNRATFSSFSSIHCKSSFMTRPIPKNPQGLSLVSSHRFMSFNPVTILKKTKEGIKHTAHGFSAFAYDVKIAYSLLKRMLEGEMLDRRDRRKLNQTMADMFRLVPFSIFIIVPFLELALPFVIAMFPGFLPSTFEGESTKKMKRIKRLKASIQYAHFLEDTLAEMVVDLNKESQSAELTISFDELKSFMTKVKLGKLNDITETEISRMRKIFLEALPLGKLSGEQLKKMCQFMSIAPFGPDSMLRLALRMKLKAIKSDDMELYAIGVENLPLEEVLIACRARGIRTDNGEGDCDEDVVLTEEQKTLLRDKLKTWLHLSLKENLSNSLLLMIQVFNVIEVSTVGREVSEYMTTKAKEQIDRERDHQLLQEEIEDKIKDPVAPMADVLNDYEEIQTDIKQTIKLLQDVKSTSKKRKSARILEKRLAHLAEDLRKIVKEAAKMESFADPEISADLQKIVKDAADIKTSVDSTNVNIETKEIKIGKKEENKEKANLANSNLIANNEKEVENKCSLHDSTSVKEKVENKCSSHDPKPVEAANVGNTSSSSTSVSSLKSSSVALPPVAPLQTIDKNIDLNSTFCRTDDVVTHIELETNDEQKSVSVSASQ